MPWKVTTILWPAIVAALMPLELADVIKHFPDILSRLEALDAEGHDLAESDRSRPHQLEDFRSRFLVSIRKAA